MQDLEVTQEESAGERQAAVMPGNAASHRCLEGLDSRLRGNDEKTGVSDLSTASRAIGFIVRGAKKIGAAVRSLIAKVNPDVWREFGFVSLSAYSLLMPRREAVEEKQQDGYPPVVLVHGLGGNPGVWLPMRLFLKLHGRSRVYSFGYGEGNVEEHAGKLARFVESVLRKTGETRVDMVAHSLGGIIARYAVQLLDLGSSTRTFITLATPHQGTYAAWYANTPVTRALRPNSDLLRQINQAGGAADVARFVNVYSDRDIYVVPASGMTHPDAENVFIPGLSHSQYLISPKVFSFVAFCLGTSLDDRTCTESGQSGDGCTGDSQTVGNG